MIFHFIFLLKSLNGKLTSDFHFPDPIRDRETPFCPIDPLLTTNAEVRCTNSAFRTEFFSKIHQKIKKTKVEYQQKIPSSQKT